MHGPCVWPMHVPGGSLPLLSRFAETLINYASDKLVPIKQVSPQTRFRVNLMKPNVWGTMIFITFCTSLSRKRKKKIC